MVTPKWVRTECQPISIRDVLRYLVAVVEHEDTVGGVLEIGGPDVLSYAEMMAAYAEVAGLPRRRLLPVPVLSPRLSSLWVGLVTPVPAQLARPLVDSLVNRGGGDRPSCRGALPVRTAVAHRGDPPGDHEHRVGQGPHQVRRRVLAGLAVEQHRSRLDRRHGGDRRAHRRRRRPTRIPCGARSAGSAARAVGTAARRSGGCAGSPTRSSAAPDCGAAAATRSGSRSASPLDFWRVERPRAGPVARAPRGDAPPGGGVARVDRSTRRRGGSAIVQTARYRPRGLFGPRLLVRRAAVPLAGVPRDSCTGSCRTPSRSPPRRPACCCVMSRSLICGTHATSSATDTDRSVRSVAGDRSVGGSRPSALEAATVRRRRARVRVLGRGPDARDPGRPAARAVRRHQPRDVHVDHRHRARGHRGRRAWAGGKLADRIDPRRLLGPTVVASAGCSRCSPSRSCAALGDQSARAAAAPTLSSRSPPSSSPRSC